jgi:hypothetical protein
VSLSLANLFPRLSYPVVRQIGAEHHEALFAAQAKHASQALGESATKEFVLTHIFKISPHLISRPEDLWRELLRLHYRDAGLPLVLADHVAHVLGDHAAFKDLPISELFASKSTLLRVVQDAWYRYLSRLGLTGTRTGEPTPADFLPRPTCRLSIRMFGRWSTRCSWTDCFTRSPFRALLSAFLSGRRWASSKIRSH